MDNTNSDKVSVVVTADTRPLARDYREAIELTKAFGSTLKKNIQAVEDGVLAPTRRAATKIPVAARKIQSALKLLEKLDGTVRLNERMKETELRLGRNLSSIRDLAGAAKESLFGIDELGTVYLGLARASNDLGVSNQRLVAASRTLARSIRLGEEPAVEQQKTIAKLSKSFVRGAIDAESFASALESSRSLSETLKSGLGLTTDADLFDLVREGQLGVQSFIEAIERVGIAVDGAFNRRQPSFEELSNNFSSTLESVVVGSEPARKSLEELKGLLATVTDLIDSDIVRNGVDRTAIAFNQSARDVRRYADEFSNFVAAVNGLDFSSFDNLKRSLDVLKREFGDSFFGSGKSDLIRRPIEKTRPEPIIQSVNRSGKSDRLPTSIGQPSSRPVASPTLVAPTRKGDDEQLRLAKQVLLLLIQQINAHRETAAAIDESAKKRAEAVQVERAEVELRKENASATDNAKKNLDTLSGAHTELARNLENTASSQVSFNQSLVDLDPIARDALGGFIDDLRNGESAADALENALRRIEDRLIDIALDSLFPSTGGGLFGGLLSGAGGGLLGGFFGFSKGGPVTGFAAGGRVTGPGGPLSDQVPILASNGEFVVNAAAFRRNPALFEQLNDGTLDPARFAEGDVIGAVEARIGNLDLVARPPAGTVSARDLGAAVVRAIENTPPVLRQKVVNTIDPGEVVSEGLSSAAGEKMLINMLRANRSKARGALGL